MESNSENRRDRTDLEAEMDHARSLSAGGLGSLAERAWRKLEQFEQIKEM